jgi:LysM repeat protein
MALGLLVALAAPWSSGAKSDLSAAGSAPAVPALSAHTVYIVQPGDTLWSIAQRLDPRSDPRPVVALLSAQINSDTVRPGEHLRLP